MPRNKRIPRDFIAFDAARNKSLLSLGHPRLCETIEQVVDS